MSALHVFLGPSLPAADALAVAPRALLLPPVRHGDLLRLPAGAGDTVLVVDGLFHQSLPVRHKEVLHLLDRGVRVFGSSSMGALRAAELHPFGMTGLGRIFAMYRDGVLTADDEVAVAHAGDGDFRAVGDPLVNIRHGARQAARAGVVTDDEAARVVESARALPFPSRSWRLAVRRTGGLDPAAGERLLAWIAAHRVETDLKRLDALEALAFVTSPEGTADAPAGPPWPPLREPGSPQLWRTDRLRGWTLRHDVREADGRDIPAGAEIHYAQLTDPAFPARWYAACLRRMADLPVVPAAAGARGLAEAEAKVLAEAAERGLTLATLRPDHVGTLLSDAERSGLSRDAALLRLLVRLSGMSPGVLPGADDPGATDQWVAALVADRAATRAAVAAAFAANAAMTAADPRRRVHTIRPDVLRRDLGALWGTDEHAPGDLLRAARDRGFATFTAATEVFRYFAVACRESADRESADRANAGRDRADRGTADRGVTDRGITDRAAPRPVAEAAAAAGAPAPRPAGGGPVPEPVTGGRGQ